MIAAQTPLRETFTRAIGALDAELCKPVLTTTNILHRRYALLSGKQSRIRGIL